jgi:hypothetical protein
MVYSELKVKEYKELLKGSFGDEPNTTIFFDTLFEIFEKLTGKPVSFFYQELTILDMFYLLLDMRNNFLDNVCKVVIMNDDKQMNLELRLDYIQEELIEVYSLIQDKIIADSNFEIILGYPCINRLLDNSEHSYLRFIKELRILNSNNEIQSIQIQTNEQARLLIEKITPKKLFEIINHYESLTKEIANYNFLDRYNIPQSLNIVPTIDMFVWLTKLIFSESLLDFYDNLFCLACYGHMNPEYIENCSVGEYKLFVSQLKQTMNSKEQKDSQHSEDEYEDDGLLEEIE